MEWNPERVKAMTIAGEESLACRLRESRTRWPGKAELIRDIEEFVAWLRDPGIESVADKYREKLKRRDRIVVRSKGEIAAFI